MRRVERPSIDDALMPGETSTIVLDFQNNKFSMLLHGEDGILIKETPLSFALSFIRYCIVFAHDNTLQVINVEDPVFYKLTYVLQDDSNLSIACHPNHDVERFHVILDDHQMKLVGHSQDDPDVYDNDYYLDAFQV